MSTHASATDATRTLCGRVGRRHPRSAEPTCLWCRRLLRPTLPREMGKHAGCGGTVWYYTTGSQGWRECSKCKADGRYGRPTPEVER